MEVQDTFIIIGGGIGGLATALALQKSGYNAKIYERDVHFNSRQQGYSLTIQRNGFKALQKLGIADDVQKLGNDSVIFGMTTYNHLGETILSKSKTNNSNRRYYNFAVQRQSLRQCLMNNLAADTIHWNKSIIQYETILNDPTHIRVSFSDNTFVIGRALIGCDGVHSLVRKQMLNDELNYLDVWAINGISSHNNNNQFFVNQTIQILDGKSRLFIKPFSINQSMWQYTFKAPKLSSNDLEEFLNRVRNATKDWFQPIPEFICNTQLCDIRAGPLFDRDPLNVINKDIPCVTMLGDAVHPMSPFKGQGANQALIDAVNLVEYLKQYQDKDKGIEHAFVEFEKEMLNRSKIYMQRSRSAVNFLHTENALLPENMLQFLSE